MEIGSQVGLQKSKLIVNKQAFNDMGDAVNIIRKPNFDQRYFDSNYDQSGYYITSKSVKEPERIPFSVEINLYSNVAADYVICQVWPGHWHRLSDSTGVDLEIDAASSPDFTYEAIGSENWWVQSGNALAANTTGYVYLQLQDSNGTQAGYQPSKLALKISTTRPVAADDYAGTTAGHAIKVLSSINTSGSVLTVVPEWNGGNIKDWYDLVGSTEIEPGAPEEEPVAPYIKIHQICWTRNGIKNCTAVDAGEEFLSVAYTDNDYIYLQLTSDESKDPSLVPNGVSIVAGALPDDIGKNNIYFILGKFTAGVYDRRWFGGDIDDLAECPDTNVNATDTPHFNTLERKTQGNEEGALQIYEASNVSTDLKALPYLDTSSDNSIHWAPMDGNNPVSGPTQMSLEITSNAYAQIHGFDTASPTAAPTSYEDVDGSPYYIVGRHVSGPEIIYLNLKDMKWKAAETSDSSGYSDSAGSVGSGGSVDCSAIDWTEDCFGEFPFWRLAGDEDNCYGSAIGSAAGVLRISLSAGIFYDSSLGVSGDFDNYQLYSGGVLSLDWGLGLLKSGTTTVADWLNQTLYDSAGKISVDWDDRKLKDNAEVNSVDYKNRMLLKGAAEVVKWDTASNIGIYGANAAIDITTTGVISIAGADDAAIEINAGGGIGITADIDGGVNITSPLKADLTYPNGMDIIEDMGQITIGQGTYDLSTAKINTTGAYYCDDEQGVTGTYTLSNVTSITITGGIITAVS